MKLAIISFLVASMNASVYGSASGLRLTSSQESKAIATNEQSSENKDGRELLSSWCDPATPVEWHPDYSRAWSTSGCVQKQDCDSPGYADEATCCAGQYGGQTGGACSSTVVNPNNGKYYADYATPWSTAGCKNTVPHPIYAAVFYTTQLECCNAAFGGQGSNACVKGLPNPPTSKPTVAPTTVAPTTKSPTTAAGQGGNWYADYATAWPAAGCKNTTPLPNYATMLYATQLECCKGAFGGQTSNACVKGLPSPPTSTPTASPTMKPTSSPSIAPTKSPSKAPTTSSPSKAPTNSPSKAPTTKSPSKAPTLSPTASPTNTPTSSPSKAPTTSSPSKAPTTSSPSKAPVTLTPTALQWYPLYNGICSARHPLPQYGSRPFFASKEECCQATYDSWGGTRTQQCITGSTN